MASAGNRHCANCIGALSFPVCRSAHREIRIRALHAVTDLRLVHSTWTELQLNNKSTQLHASRRVHWSRASAPRFDWLQ